MSQSQSTNKILFATCHAKNGQSNKAKASQSKASNSVYCRNAAIKMIHGD
ncbi:hypothetical protein OH492_09335 [Vibrio chagasii]|nr:hypothetical protein [Vibrio chagasii]